MPLAGLLLGVTKQRWGAVCGGAPGGGRWTLAAARRGTRDATLALLLPVCVHVCRPGFCLGTHYVSPGLVVDAGQALHSPPASPRYLWVDVTAGPVSYGPGARQKGHVSEQPCGKRVCGTQGEPPFSPVAAARLVGVGAARRGVLAGV